MKLTVGNHQPNTAIDLIWVDLVVRPGTTATHDRGHAAMLIVATEASSRLFLAEVIDCMDGQTTNNDDAANGPIRQKSGSGRFDDLHNIFIC